jgi:adenylylsulfate kinase
MTLVAMMGLPGSGKSALARRIAPVLPAVILDKDAIRAVLFPPAEIEYSVQQDDFCVEIMLQTAAYLLRKGCSVILDGRPFSRRYQVEAVVNFALKAGLALKVVECVCADESIRKRLEADVASRKHLARNRTFTMYQNMKTTADLITVPRLVVDTDQPLDESLSACLDYITQDAGD